MTLLQEKLDNMRMQIRSKAEARQRVDQIEAFRSELGLLEQEGVVTLIPEQRAGCIIRPSVLNPIF